MTHRTYIPRGEQWQSISFGSGIVVSEGDSMALVVRSELGTIAPGAKFVWRTASAGDPYPAGDRHFFTSPSWQEIAGDYGFRTYLVAPEPSTGTLIALGLAGMAFARRYGHLS